MKRKALVSIWAVSCCLPAITFRRASISLMLTVM